MSKKFDIYIDTGGTFTDCIGIDEKGEIYCKKVLSSSALRGTILRQISSKALHVSDSLHPERDIFQGYTFRILQKKLPENRVESYDVSNKIIELQHPLPLDRELTGLNYEISSNEETPVLGARLITQTALGEAFPTLNFKLGSTKGTNALLERKGAKTLLVITKGFRDLLEIGDQARPDIFAMHVHKRKQIINRILEVDERIDAQGNILTPLDCEEFLQQLQLIEQTEIESVAIALMNAYVNPKHERMLKGLFREAGFNFISVSHEISPLIKFLNRAETTVVNAYLSPIINNYVDQISEKIGDCPFHIMTSAGGLTFAKNFYPKDSLLSGPAGGVVGAAVIGAKAGFHRLITFDMGGTSTDVSRIDASFDYRYVVEVGDARINSPALAIETVAAGGGSICWYDGHTLKVGPESAGAHPGPACYGAGGPLTITDVNLLAGRLDPSQFGIPVFKQAAEEKLSQLIDEMARESGKKNSTEVILQGFIDIANEIMAAAIRKISIAKGYNPKDYTMVAFGGAGGLHACDIASILGISTILLPRHAGLLSAQGIGNARIERFAERQVLKKLSKIEPRLATLFVELENEARAQFRPEGIPVHQLVVRQKMVFMRLQGQDASLEIIFDGETPLESLFHREYEKIYGHVVRNRIIEVESVRVLVSTKEIAHAIHGELAWAHAAVSAHKLGNSTPVYFRNANTPGAAFQGPALFLDQYSTTFVNAGWKLQIDQNETAILSRTDAAVRQEQQSSSETELALFTNRFMAIAEEVGAMLQRTALSVNIKERLDFSCALLDAQGYLVANAPHIPVHLGSLGVCVRAVLAELPLEPGDTIVTNHPKYGGSHLPDVTVISPVFHDNARVGFIVSRAHHSEIGGKSPGSMPPDAVNLEQEGVVISPFYLVKNGRVNWRAMETILSKAAWPSRSVNENLADLNAALAANRNGIQNFRTLIEMHGIEKVVHNLNLLKAHAAAKMRQALRQFNAGQYAAKEYLDDGSVLAVKIQITDGLCHIDFTGTSTVHAGNMNATPAIVNSVVIYVMRMLLDEPIPLNDGLLQPVTLQIPTCLLNPPFPDDPQNCPAVVGGNVELSQRLTDTLLKAFNVMAASQGTMNNVVFGNKNFGYYETICGGCGAGNGFDGASAVHHHMTNTHITDPEIMELRYPVRLQAFGIRKNSGGPGTWRGGDGVVRRYLFLEPVNLSVLTQRRKTGPFGSHGGSAGKPGSQKVIRKSGEVVPLSSSENIDLAAGDQFEIYTPGGGGFGKAK